MLRSSSSSGSTWAAGAATSAAMPLVLDLAGGASAATRPGAHFKL